MKKFGTLVVGVRLGASVKPGAEGLGWAPLLAAVVLAGVVAVGVVVAGLLGAIVSVTEPAPLPAFLPAVLSTARAEPSTFALPLALFLVGVTTPPVAGVDVVWVRGFAFGRLGVVGVVVGVVGVVGTVVGVVSALAVEVGVVGVGAGVEVVGAGVVAVEVGVPGISTTETTGEPKSPSWMLPTGVPGATSTVTGIFLPFASVTSSWRCSADALTAVAPSARAATPAI